ncbi:MAG: dTDP-4-dehydrorhamnose 3,5-epimerase [Krumholzibacteria bacterium]|nr:dTDP-4-dehydrorhamnose 3,5-epimerase [Candidatus Krumholzibacteria bacterium]
MKFVPTGIPEVLVVEPRVLGDERGYFMEIWRDDLFRTAGIDAVFVQDNQSSSGRGVLRGLHYQIVRPQGKLVRVIAGRVFDVAVDLRRSSPTCGRWTGVELSDSNRRQLWVPPGFGHGFYVLSGSAEFVYKCSDSYAPEHERVIRWDDPDLGIAWPLVPGVETVLSDKDRAGVPFAAAELYP